MTRDKNISEKSSPHDWPSSTNRVRFTRVTRGSDTRHMVGNCQVSAVSDPYLMGGVHHPSLPHLLQQLLCRLPPHVLRRGHRVRTVLRLLPLRHVVRAEEATGRGLGDEGDAVPGGSAVIRTEGFFKGSDGSDGGLKGGGCSSVLMYIPDNVRECGEDFFGVLNHFSWTKRKVLS